MRPAQQIHAEELVPTARHQQSAAILQMAWERSSLRPLASSRFTAMRDTATEASPDWKARKQHSAPLTPTLGTDPSKHVGPPYLQHAVGILRLTLREDLGGSQRLFLLARTAVSPS